MCLLAFYCKRGGKWKYKLLWPCTSREHHVNKPSVTGGCDVAAVNLTSFCCCACIESCTTLKIIFHRYESRQSEIIRECEQSGMQQFAKSSFEDLFDGNNNDNCGCQEQTETSNCFNMKDRSLSPTSPSKRKVQFADCFGRSLVSVKIITPTNSEENLDVNKKLDLALGFSKLKEKPLSNILLCRFKQPGAQTDFTDRVQKQFVCLENLAFSGLVVTGVVRVLNISFAKEVTVRYTTNNWQGLMDIWADYVPNSSDGITDQFSFRVSLPREFDVGDRFEFAVRYKVAGKCYWDNNDEKNYCVDCCRDRTA